VGTSFATQPVSPLPDPLSPSGPSDGPPIRRLLADRQAGDDEARMAQRRRDMEALVWTAFTATEGRKLKQAMRRIKGPQHSTASHPIGAHYMKAHRPHRRLLPSPFTFPPLLPNEPLTSLLSLPPPLPSPSPALPLPPLQAAHVPE
jgi:hypothetical protein